MNKSTMINLMNSPRSKAENMGQLGGTITSGRAEKRRYGIMFCKHRDESNMPQSLDCMDKSHICKYNASNGLSGIIYSLTYLLVYGVTVILPCDTMTLLSMCVASIPFLRLACSFASNLVIALMLQHDKRVIAFAFCLSFSCGLCSNITL